MMIRSDLAGVLTYVVYAFSYSVVGVASPSQKHPTLVAPGPCDVAPVAERRLMCGIWRFRA